MKPATNFYLYISRSYPGSIFTTPIVIHVVCLVVKCDNSIIKVDFKEIYFLHS